MRNKLFMSVIVAAGLLVAGLSFAAGPPPPFAFQINPALILPTGCTNGQIPAYNTTTKLWACSTASGTGDVAKVGTPANYQWGEWTGDGTLKGTAVTASKVVCTDSNGSPTACTNLTDVAFSGYVPTSWISRAGTNNVLTYTGNYSLGLTLTGNTSVTLPTSGTLATTALKPSDLAISSQAAGDVIYFNGTNWVRLAKDTGKYLKSGDSAVSWDTPTGAAHDAVSLAASATPILGLSTQELSFDTQTANYVLAGPTTGAAAAPTFRALVAADIPANLSTLDLSVKSVSTTAATTTGGYIRLMEGSDNGTDYSQIQGRADAGTYPAFIFSGSQGSEDLVLTASNDLWTFSSTTGAKLAVTPALTLTGGITSIGAASNLSGGTVTLGTLAGAIDAGGATSFEIPNGASPTVDAAGEIAVDTTSDTLKFYGSAVRVLPSKKFFSVVVPSVADTDDMFLLKLPYAITAASLDCIVSAATSATINIQECGSDGTSCTDMATSDLACDTDGANTTTFNNAVADAGDWLKLDVASISGTPGTLTVTFTYYVNED